MRFTSVIHILGFLLMFLAVAMLLPVGISLIYRDGDIAALGITTALTLFCGFAAYGVTRFRSTDIRPREGFAIVTLGWVFFSLFGALPFIMHGSIPSFTDAFFETMSGFTTTGATILTDIEVLPHGLLFWRSLTHWIGGMGIIVLSLAILPFLGVGGMQLFKAEVPGPVADRLTPRIAETAKILWGVYVAFTALETLLLWWGGMPVFDAACHAFGTMATGGYATKNASMGYYASGFIQWVVIVFMMIAGTNFSLHYRAFRGDWKAYFRNQEFLFFLSIVGLAILVIGIDTFMHHYQGVEKTLRDTVFQVMSIVTTTGYGTADYEQWSYASQFALFMLMFFGGCAGSTGGGMKMMRIHLLVKFVFAEITRLIHPRAVVPVRIGKQAIEREVVANVVGFAILYIVIFVAGTFLMTAMGVDMVSSFGAVAAALNNIGPGLGSVGPTDNYAHIPAAGKWLLSFLMLTGRLEVYTVIILLSFSYWKK